MATDKDIYESHPDIKALNDEYVSLGKGLPALADTVVSAREALIAATEQQRKIIADAENAVVDAKRAYDLAVDKRKAVQAKHNAAMEAAAKQE